MNSVFKLTSTLMAAAAILMPAQLFSQPDSLVVCFSEISAAGELDNPSIELEWEVWKKVPGEDNFEPYNEEVRFILTAEATEAKGWQHLLDTTLTDNQYVFKRDVKTDRKYRFELAVAGDGIVDITKTKNEDDRKYGVGFITLYKKRKISSSDLYRRLRGRITESQIGKFFKYGGKPPFYVSYLLLSICIIGPVSLLACKLFPQKGNPTEIESHKLSLKCYRVMRAIAEFFSSPEFFRVFWKVALMLGLFGTVSGISKTFGKVSILSSFTPQKNLIKSLSSGINEALYTTIGGLIVGIFFAASYYVLKWLMSRNGESDLT